MSAEATPRSAASSCAGPEKTRNGSPLGFLRTSMLRQPIALPMPVPNALETASFAAKRAARWRAGNFIEIEYSMSMKFPARHLAARFAAKEAVSKAFGTGIGKAMGWRNIDVRKKPSGEPFLVFSGPAQELAAERGVRSALITLSHTEHHAMASVVLEGATSQPG